MKSFKNQRGAVPLLLLVAIIGVIGVLGISKLAPFNEGVLSGIFPKKDSDAAVLLPSCWPNAVPAGALPGQPLPIWCYTDFTAPVPDTHVESGNSWLDDFNHGIAFGEFKSNDGGYLVYEGQGEIGKSKHWRHANHWMVDVAGYNEGGNGVGGAWGVGGSMMRPNKAFRFEDFSNDSEGKKLVVEVDTAAGIAAHGPGAWPEVVISTTPQPISPGTATLYAMEQLIGPGIWTFGCRIGTAGMVCASFDSRGGPHDRDGRLFETPFHGMAGSTYWDDGVYTNPNPLRKCENTDPDTNCRDRFRFEFTKNSFRVFVNGYQYIAMTNMPAEKQFSDEMLNGDVYVYFADWVGKPATDTVRFHWDRIAVNPKDAQGNLAGLSAPADFCLNAPNGVCPVGGPTPTVSPSPTPMASASIRPSQTPTPTPTPKPTSTPVPTPTVKPSVLPTPTPTPSPSPVTGTGDGLLGTYYKDYKFADSPAFTRIDPEVNFNWSKSAPDPRVGADKFMVVWTGSVVPKYSQTYNFCVTSDDGSRLWVNNKMLINKWNDQSATRTCAKIALTANQKFSIRLEYYENKGHATAKLEWQSPSQARQIIPKSKLYSN